LKNGRSAERKIEGKMLIKVKVFQNSKKEKITKKFEDSFEVKVKEKAITGKNKHRSIFAIKTSTSCPTSFREIAYITRDLAYERIRRTKDEQSMEAHYERYCVL